MVKESLASRQRSSLQETLLLEICHFQLERKNLKGMTPAGLFSQSTRRMCGIHLLLWLWMKVASEEFAEGWFCLEKSGQGVVNLATLGSAALWGGDVWKREGKESQRKAGSTMTEDYCLDESSLWPDVLLWYKMMPRSQGDTGICDWVFSFFL